jgi:hypothetical protein
MSRIGLTVVVVAAFALGVPGAAVANHHHHKRHARHSHRVRSHIKKFAPANPSAPTTTAPSDNAGTVTSFDPATGVLTLTLNDNSTVTGKVTKATEIDCESATSVSSDVRTRSSHDGPGDNNGGGDENAGTNPTTGTTSGGDDNGDGDHNNGDDGDADDNQGTQPVCDSSSLVKTAVVREAELRIDSSGATFKKIVLVK